MAHLEKMIDKGSSVAELTLKREEIAELIQKAGYYMEWSLAITYTNYAYPLQAVIITIYVKWTERQWRVP